MIYQITLALRIYARNIVELNEISEGLLDFLRSNQYSGINTTNANLYDFVVASSVDIPPNPEGGEQIVHSRIIRVQYLLIVG